MSHSDLSKVVGVVGILVLGSFIGCSSGSPGGGGDGGDGGDQGQTTPTQAMIGPEGSTIASPEGILVTVPEGAFSETTAVSISAVASSQLTALPPTITPGPTAFGIDFGGHEPERPIEVTLSIPTAEQLSATETFPCVLVHQSSSASWSLPAQAVREDGIVVLQLLTHGELAVCGISESVGTRAKQRMAKELSFVFGQDNLMPLNWGENLPRHPTGACWGFSHFAAWHYAHHRCEHLHDKYPFDVQTDIVQDAQDELRSLPGSVALLTVIIQNSLAIGEFTGILPDAHDLLTVGVIKAHLEVLGAPAVVTLFSQEGLLRVAEADVLDLVVEPTLNVFADLLGGGAPEQIDLVTRGAHAVVVFSCAEGVMSIYDPNFDYLRSIQYSALGGIFPYDNGLTYENMVYEPDLVQEQMKLIHDCYQADATISPAACNGDDDGGEATPLPEQIVMWGDPDPDSDAMFATVRDVNNEDDRFVVIGTDGSVQFSIGKVCNVCTVEDSTILVDGGRINIRFGPGPNGTGERRPFLVSDEGYYIQLVTEADTVVFVAETVVFEEPNDPSDDLTVRVGSFPNPALEN